VEYQLPLQPSHISQLEMFSRVSDAQLRLTMYQCNTNRLFRPSWSVTPVGSSSAAPCVMNWHLWKYCGYRGWIPIPVSLPEYLECIGCARQLLRCIVPLLPPGHPWVCCRWLPMDMPSGIVRRSIRKVTSCQTRSASRPFARRVNPPL
jgi:hypothetical protein